MFSLGKLLFLALLLGGAWVGWRWLRRVEQIRARIREERAAAAPTSVFAQRTAEEMQPCPVCRVYVPVSGAGPCGRHDCPFAGR